MKIMPLGDRVVIQNVGAEEQTKGGLYLATTAKEKPQMAQVWLWARWQCGWQGNHHAREGRPESYLFRAAPAPRLSDGEEQHPCAPV